ncbi:MAG TPA: hypothetical protein VNT77_03470 [Allosphingosinicella sp.]|nr:hypothetical protein [Allosphingosinicella sp.]
MKKLSKTMTGVAAAALVTLTAAAPAQAQYRDRYDRDGIDVGDIVRGVAIAGAAAAAVGVLTNAVRGGGYGGRVYEGGYGNYAHGNRYAYGEQLAVDACAFQAQRYGGRVSVTDVDRSGSSSYRVRGVIDAGNYNSGYGTYNRGYERLDNYSERRSFSCKARQDGRITDFDTKRA